MANGQWQAYRSTMPQPSGRNFYVARNISERDSFSHWEQLRDDYGVVWFSTLLEAQTAAATLNG